MNADLTLAQVKKIGLEGLLELHRVCEEFNLAYYLAYGTLIGAARHQGFIPWDDDIDIWMPRADYTRLLELSKSELLFNSWELQAFSTNKKYMFPWMKLTNLDTIVIPSRFNNGFEYGISIDIFPLDGVNGDNEEACSEKRRELRNKFVEILKKTRVLVDIEHNTMVRMIEKIYSRTVGKKYNYIKEISQLEKEMINENKTRFCTCVYDFYGAVWETNDFDTPIKIKFEGYDFNVPKNYDSVLRVIYGDYMELPPVEKQVIPHTYKAFKIGR